MNYGGFGHGQRVGVGQGRGISTYISYWVFYSSTNSEKQTFFKNGSGRVCCSCGRGDKRREQRRMYCTRAARRGRPWGGIFHPGCNHDFSYQHSVDFALFRKGSGRVCFTCGDENGLREYVSNTGNL